MGLRGDLDTQEFNELLLGELGEVPLSYRQYMGPCPHCNPEGQGNVRDMTHALCGGTGQLYEDLALPTDNPETLGNMVCQNAQVGKTVSGVTAIQGDVTCTFCPDDYPMAEEDRLLLSSRVHRHRTVMSRGATLTDDLPQYVPATEIVAIYGVDAKLLSYALSADGRSVVWTGTGDTPAEGASYTITYKFRPVWQVPKGTQLKRVLAENGDPFPGRVILRMFQHADTDKEVGGMF